MVKIVKIKGGLGNQLFQYAFGRMLHEKYGYEVKYDLRNYQSVHDEINILKLNSFNTIIEPASYSELKRFSRFPIKCKPMTAMYRFGIVANKILAFNTYYFERKRAYKNPDSLIKYQYFDGYWQCERFFIEIRQKLLAELTLKKMSDATRKTVDRMQAENAVFIGIRRPYEFESAGMKASLNDISKNIYYYEKAIAYVYKRVENPVFYVFSNDINWVRDNIEFPCKVIYRTKEMQISDEEELVLMMSCKHAIISNSTFNWWGAWLIKNPEKIVITPEHWQGKTPTDIIPDSWVKYDMMIKG